MLAAQRWWMSTTISGEESLQKFGLVIGHVTIADSFATDTVGVGNNLMFFTRWQCKKLLCTVPELLNLCSQIMIKADDCMTSGVETLAKGAGDLRVAVFDFREREADVGGHAFQRLA